MGRGSSHRTITHPLATPDGASVTFNVATYRAGFEAGFRAASEGRPMYCSPREWLAFVGSERAESRAVANLSDGAPVGERMASDSLVEVQRKGGLPNQSGRS